MANENTISVTFTAAEETNLNTAISTIAGILNGKALSLTPSQRQQFGRVKYEKEVWVDKVKMHMDQNPAKVPAYIDKAEFDRDYTAHKLLNTVINSLEQQLQLMEDTNLLLGYDLDTNALMFYRNIRTAADNNDPGAQTIYDDLKQQFPGGGKKKAATPPQP
jgi:hypothetical protein